MPNVWNAQDVATILNRVDHLTPTSRPLWGKMSVGQMLAHCNVTYELTYENIHPKPNFILRLLLKLFLKGIVTGDKPYKKNSPTGGAFMIKETKDFEFEKKRLIAFIQRTQQEGEAAFEGRDYVSFGILSAKEWNHMLYKHLDHHLSQFGA